MIPLGLPKISGCVPLADHARGRNVVCRIPANAAQPAHLCVRNIDAAAVVYLKTIPLAQGGKVTATDHGIQLSPGEGYDWNGCPPRGVDVIALSTVNNSLLAAEGNWCITEDDE